MSDDSNSNKNAQVDSDDLSDTSAVSDEESFEETDSSEESFEETDSSEESFEETDSEENKLEADSEQKPQSEEEEEEEEDGAQDSDSEDSGNMSAADSDSDDDDDAPSLKGLLKGDEDDDRDTFATSSAPWVGAEKKWMKEKEQKPVEPEGDDDPDMLLDDSLETLSSPLAVGRDSSLPPPVIGPHSLPALSMAYDQPQKKMSTEAKLGIVAIVLAVVILLGAIGWWLIGLRTESEQARMMAEKLSQELNARDQMRANQEATIAKLEERIQKLSESGNPENQAQVNELKAQIVAAQAEIAEIETTPLETTQEIAEEIKKKQTREGTAQSKELSKEQEGKNQGKTEGKSEEKPEGKTDEPKKEDQSAIPSDPYAEEAQNQAQEAEPQPVKPETKGSNDVDDLIESAISGPKKPDLNTLPTEETGGMPKVPSREQVKTAMNAVAPAVKRCSQGNSGRIQLQISVSGATGRVLNAQPIGEHSGTAVGICAARAVRVAKFPKFSQDNLVIKYPFDL